MASLYKRQLRAQQITEDENDAGILVVGQRKPVVTLALAQNETLNLSDSGALVVIGIAAGGANRTITVPVPAAGNIGLNYRFVMGVANATNDWLISTGAANFVGNLTNCRENATDENGLAALGSLRSILGFDSTADFGDEIEIVSTGVFWVVRGFFGIEGALLLAT